MDVLAILMRVVGSLCANHPKLCRPGCVPRKQQYLYGTYSVVFTMSAPTRQTRLRAVLPHRKYECPAVPYPHNFSLHALDYIGKYLQLSPAPWLSSSPSSLPLALLDDPSGGMASKSPIAADRLLFSRSIWNSQEMPKVRRTRVTQCSQGVYIQCMPATEMWSSGARRRLGERKAQRRFHFFFATRDRTDTCAWHKTPGTLTVDLWQTDIALQQVHILGVTGCRAA